MTNKQTSIIKQSLITNKHLVIGGLSIICNLAFDDWLFLTGGEL